MFLMTPKDPEPLTPSHLLSGRRITSLPYEQHTLDEISDPSYNEHNRLSKDVKIQNLLLQHFTARWRNEYLTSLREYHRTFGSNEFKIAAGNVVLVHDDEPRVKWRMAIVEELIHGGDGLVRAANIRTSTPLLGSYHLKYPLKARTISANWMMRARVLVQQVETPLKQLQNLAPRKIQQGRHKKC